jgi:uncharacterized protein (TIGR02001 family)
VNVKKHLFALGLVAVMASPAIAADDILPPSADSAFSITGNVALTTEYFFRGISQSNDSPAVSGGLNLNYKLSDMFVATAGVWSSSIDSGTGNGGVELDYLLGLAATVTPELTLNVGSTWFTYPGTKNAGVEPDWWEGSFGATYNFGLFSLGGMYAYSPDFNLNAGDAHYVNAKVVVPLGFVDLSGAVGKQYIEKNAQYGLKDYIDWKLAAGAKVWGIDLELAYIDTNVDQAFPSGATQAATDGAVIFTVTKNF